MTSPRTASRVAAVQALFQIELSGGNGEQVIEEFTLHRLDSRAEGRAMEDGGAPDAKTKLFSAIVRGVLRQQVTLDRLIAENLPSQWPLARLDPVLRAILRAGGAELADPKGPDVGVVISEYLNVAHGFFRGDESKLTNAVLDKVAKALRPIKEKDLGDAARPPNPP